MSKKQLERQAKYLNFLKEIERLTLNGQGVDVYRLAQEHGVTSNIIPILKEKKVIVSVGKDKRTLMYQWNTIPPNIYMVSNILAENKEKFRKYYSYEPKEKVERVKIINEAPKKKRTFSFLFGLIKFNY